MTIVVTSVIISRKCPKYLQPIADEMKKALYHAFENHETFIRFVNGVRLTIGQKKSRQKDRLNVHLTELESCGNLTISNNTDTSIVVMSFVKVMGHVHVSKDGKKIYPQEFIKEDDTELLNMGQAIVILPQERTISFGVTDNQ